MCCSRRHGKWCSPAHAELVDNYRHARHAWEERREYGDNMRMEDDEYREAHPPPTFKQWLVNNKREEQQDERTT